MDKRINKIVDRFIQRQAMRKFEVTFEGPHHGQPSIEVPNPTEEERKKIYSILNRAPYFNDPLYEINHNAGAFLQSDGPDYMLIEFWGEDYQPFVDWLNE